MKEDFIAAKQELELIGIVRICEDFYMEPIRKSNNTYFTKSPKTSDTTESLALYADSDRFCDFANGSSSGDCIGFIGYIHDLNNWQALKMLQDYYHLSSSSERDRRSAVNQIRGQQLSECKKQERKQKFQNALNGEINALLDWKDICIDYLKNGELEPFTDEWCDCTNELQLCEYKLDVLCASDQVEYCRMKTSGGQLPTDRYKWILDCLDILQKSGRFHPTKAELEEIGEQKCFEVNRKQGETRRCNIGW